jgi:hypothetical protein
MKMALSLGSSSRAEVDMVIVIGIAIAGILFLLRVLFAWLRDEWLDRESMAVVKVKLQSDEPQMPLRISRRSTSCLKRG